MNLYQCERCSRRPRGRSCPNQKLVAVLRCHIYAFVDLGGGPEEVLYDRMKIVAAVTDEEGAVVCNLSLVSPANGYRPRACRPYRATTKEKVERSHRYIRQDFFLARRFRNLDDLNAQFTTWLDKIANPRRHASTRKIVSEAFAEERYRPCRPSPTALRSSSNAGSVTRQSVI